MYKNAVETLAAGNEDVLKNMPVPIIISELPDESGGTNNLHDEDYNLDDSLNIPGFSHESHISSALQSTNVLSNSQLGNIHSTSRSTNILSSILSTSQSTSIPSTSQSTNILGSDILSNTQSNGQNISSSTQLIRTRRTSSTRLGVQLHEARQSFEKIADTEAMQMLAEAMKLQAEALVQLSQAIDKFTNKETSCHRNITNNEY
ncbi:hypothetical protein CAJAP_05155 [Camponotus japonicus]